MQISTDTRIIKRYIIFQKYILTIVIFFYRICMTIWTLRAIQPVK